MRNIKKITIALLTIMLLIPCTMNNASAQESVSNRFIELIDGIFSNSLNYDVINTSGFRVKDNFIEENRKLYENLDYSSISENFMNNNLTISSIPDMPQTRVSEAKSLTKNYYHSYRPSNFQKIEFEMQCYAVIRVNDATGVITSFSGPSVSLIWSNVGMYCIVNPHNVSTSYSWGSSTHRSITFNYRYALSVQDDGQTYISPTYEKTIRS